MKKSKIFENSDIVIYYKKGELEIGQEVELADQIFVVALMGYLEFASHLKNPMEFWIKCKKEIRRVIRMQDKEIKKL